MTLEELLQQIRAEFEFQRQLNHELQEINESKERRIQQHLNWNMILADERDTLQDQVHELQKQLLELRRNAR